jgi:Orotate phosphoribosyltransferase
MENVNKINFDVVAQKLIETGAFKVNTEDPYLLKTGIASPLYCNCRDLYRFPEQQKLIMDFLAELVREYYPHCEAIYGTPMSAISFGALVAERLGLPFGFVREEQKDHGMNTKIEGPIDDGIRIVQIEDLITSGTSSLQSVMVLKNAGAEILGVASIVDNNFIKSSMLIVNNIEYHSITTMSKIAHYAGEQRIITAAMFDKVKSYESNPLDESWMSLEATEKIFQKRLIKKSNKGKI